MSREGSDVPTTRVWQACVTCRRKKVKCDGNNPCHNCSSRDLICEYPGSNDNASNSRNYAMLFEDRFRQLDELCSKLQVVAAQLTRVVESLPQSCDIVNSVQHSDFTQQEDVTMADNSLPTETLATNEAYESAQDPTPEEGPHIPNSRGNSNEESDENSTKQSPQDGPTSTFGSLIYDMDGNQRFIGGAANELLVQTVRNLIVASPEQLDPVLVPVENGRETATLGGSPGTELPSFVHNWKLRELPYIPKPEALNLPPKYIAEMLVRLYFEHYHYSFPVLFKPSFLEGYKRLYVAPRGMVHDSGFLSVFFAVCACASGLIAPEGDHSSFPGLVFYEKALVLHLSTTGAATRERTQCLALMSMCCSGWNITSTSWHFAGQAVRAAQELGMHMSELASSHDVPTSPEALVDIELSRRIWWSIYCLDRVTSICLGRPLAANDNDCCCTLPLPLSDEALVQLYNRDGPSDVESSSMSPLSGFLAFIRLCQISGQVQSLQAPAAMQDLGTKSGTERIRKLALHQEKILEEWLKDLPDELRSLDQMVNHRTSSELSVQGLVIHAGTLITLYRTFASRKNPFSQRQTIKNCVTAARRCINTAGLVRDLIPPSHYLALCVHYLTISGLVLLRMTSPADVREDRDVEQCVRLLGELEGTWSGATRGKAIIEQTLRTFQDSWESHSLHLDIQALLENPDLDWSNLELSGGLLENT